MNRARLLRTVVLPLLIAIMATAGLYQVVSRRAPPTSGPVVETVKVVVAKQAIAARTLIKPDMVTLRDVPASYVLPGAVRAVDACAGQVTLVPLAAGEMVLTSKITSQKPGAAGLSFSIPHGKRAITVQVDEIIGVAAFPLVGDAVDILWTYRLQPSGESRTRLLLENIPLLAVVQNPTPTESGTPRELKGYSSVTLEVTVEQAAVIVNAETVGLLRLVLRPALDAGMVGDFDVSGTAMMQPQRTLNTNVDRRITLETRVLELDAKSVADLGHSTFGAAIAQLGSQQVAAINALVAQGKGRVLDRAASSAANRTSVSFSFGGEARPPDAPAAAAGAPYGLTVSLTPMHYGQPQISLDARVLLTVVDLSAAGTPISTTFSAGAAGRAASGEGLLVTGLVSAEDLVAPGATRQRFALPPGMLSEALASGERVLVVLVTPTF
jgi:pilus assembly protein CpaB